ncbi:MAG: ATP-dependent helicase [Geobacteraceae bacterium]|nr:MAG: ATP-dependent helicase [Geobacteraceae bacterium]
MSEPSPYFLTPAMTRLPIDEVLPQLLTALENHSAAVLQAPPGAGKTTRVPLALLNEPFLKNKRIVMLEPRRLAAANAARWMASCLGEEVGRTVGYAIRFERKVSPATRIEVVTEGILTNRLQSDPLLEEVGVVIFDEFHERNLNADLALALCLDVQKGVREDLKIIVMSATLEGGPIARLLGDAPVITSQGKSYPVEIRYLEREEEGDCAETAYRAIRRAMGETEGDILVFLPGAGEIRRCRKFLEETLDTQPPPLICPLYGDLPFAAQEQAIMPAGRRKVVLATNIAETSLTIEGVCVVIDSGWSRRQQFDPASGLDRLVTVRVSAASAEQRTGRAGRLGPGVCYRLWSEHTQRTLIPSAPPEIRTSDLTSLALDLARWGISDAETLSWLDSPSPAALAEGRRLLITLGALDRQGLITGTGREMAALPVHPRLAHLLKAAHRRGYGALACDLAALLSERDIFRGNRPAAGNYVSDSDMLDRVEALAHWRKRGLAGTGAAPGEVDLHACKAVDRVAMHFRRLLGIKDAPATASAVIVGLMLAWAYPDRIARQREPGSDRYLLANGRGGRLSQRSALRDQTYIVAVAMEGGERGDGMIHLASAIALEAVRTECAANIVRQRMVVWDDVEGRVTACEEERFHALVLSSRPITPSEDEVRSALLKGIIEGRGLTVLNWTPQAAQFQARVLFLAKLFPTSGWPDLSTGRLIETLAEWLGPCLNGIKSLSALSGVDILPALKGLLTWEQVRKLDEGAPTHLQAPSGSRVAVLYSPDGPPVLAVKLQELFGLADTPTVAWGKVPVLLHLLSPARRPIQVTQDLKNFWNTVYPEVKKELKGRYPKHPWPDDPWRAVPTGKTKKRERP